MRIFVSFSSRDRERAAPIIEALQGLGHENLSAADMIQPGMDFLRGVEDAINQADLVLVLWSHHSIQSDWAKAEALKAHDAGKYVGAALDTGLQIPAPFQFYHSLNLADLDGEALRSALQLALSRMDRKVSEAKRRSMIDEGASPRRQRREPPSPFDLPPAPQAPPASPGAEEEIPPFLRQAPAAAPLAPAPPPNVFISYSRKDKPACVDLFNLLVERGLTPWYDKDIGSGAFKQKIVDRIGGAVVFVLLLSQNSTASANVSKELSVASSAGKLIVPISIDATGAGDLKDTFAYELIELNIFAAPSGDIAMLAAAADIIRDSVREMGVIAAATPVVAPVAPPVPAPPRPKSGWGARFGLSILGFAGVLGVGQLAFGVFGWRLVDASALAAVAAVPLIALLAAAAALFRAAFSAR